MAVRNHKGPDPNHDRATTEKNKSITNGKEQIAIKYKIERLRSEIAIWVRSFICGKRDKYNKERSSSWVAKGWLARDAFVKDNREVRHQRTDVHYFLSPSRSDFFCWCWCWCQKSSRGMRRI